ncbi:hypothetical protein EBZ39_08370, partial [bacterium]|nr:hypothetical protein [bacterium]
EEEIEQAQNKGEEGKKIFSEYLEDAPPTKQELAESLYTPYDEELEKSEKLPHYLKFMGKHPKAQETAEWADNNIKHRNLAEFAMRHAQTKPEGLSHEEKAHIQHFHDSLHMAEVQKAAGSLTSKHDFNSGLQILKDAEGEYLKRHAATAPKLVPHEGQKVIDLGDGVAVYNLPLNHERKNPNEAVALGHCATPHQGGQLWSIRKDHGNGQAEPLVTISHEGGYLGEIKGKANWKPSTKFHPYLAKLMASDLVKGFVGGGYAPESNFEFSDMKEGLRKKLLDYKPSLKQRVYKEELPKGFQTGYSHTPEVKSIFNTNDIQAQIDYLSKHPPGSIVHQNAAQNENITPELLKHLIDTNKAGSDVHQNAAANENITPELLKHLIDVNQAGSIVHLNAVMNQNIHPELLKHLIDVNQAGSYVHRNAARNENITPELLKHLIDVNEAGSYVHRKAAQNENITPELLKHLIENNKSGSLVHEAAALNKNITPELLKHLIDVNEAGSYVHRNAARNKKITPEALKYLVEKNQADSEVHSNAALNKNIAPELLKHLIDVNEAGSYVHRNAARNENIHPELLKHLIDVNEAGSWVHEHAAENPQFKNLPPETQMLVRPYVKENMQKLISIMNDEENPEEAKLAHKELKARRKEKYDRILSHEGNVEDLLHYAESHDGDVSKRAREELRRRNLIKAERPMAPAKPMAEASEHSQGEAMANLYQDENPPQPELTHAAEGLRGLEGEFHQMAQQQNQAPKSESGNQELKSRLAGVLQKLKGQAPVLEQMKQQAPETYAAIMAMVQSVISMARSLSSDAVQEPKKQEEQAGGKTEHPLYTPYNEELEKSEKLPHYLKFMGSHPKAQETAEWADNNIKHRNLAEFAMRHAQTKPEGLSHEEKAHIQHFHDSLHMAEVQKAAGSLTPKHDFNSGLELLRNAEGEYLKRHAATAPKLVPHEGKKIIDLGDGVAVYDLPLNDKRKNPNEAVALGHCATPHQGGQLWSIRKDHGNGQAEPLVTISHEGGYLGEIKGKANWKPSTKFHPYLAKLMASDLVKGFVGGGYAPESNFEFSDMKEGLRKKLLDYKPSLKQKVYKEELPEGFQTGYSHTPEVKSIFNTNDIQAQMDFLSKHPPGSIVHYYAAENKNITPELLKYLIEKNLAGSEVHVNAAQNENIHPELLKHLIDVNEAGSYVHEYAAQNENIHPELLKHLIDTNEAGSGVHKYAAENPQFKNLPPETQMLVRPYVKENMQKLISIMNDEENPKAAKVAHKELKARRKEKYDRILSHEGSVEDLLHYAESHDNDVSERAREELRRRNLIKSERQDILHGGAADEKDYGDFDPEQLKIGIKHEMEHTKSAKIAAEIAMDHLTEDPDYYKKLKTIEKTDLPTSGRHKLVLPPGSTITTGPQGRKNAGKIKVQHGNGKSSWVHVRSGQVLSEDGHAISSRNPKGR